MDLDKYVYEAIAIMEDYIDYSLESENSGNALYNKFYNDEDSYVGKLFDIVAANSRPIFKKNMGKFYDRDFVSEEICSFKNKNPKYVKCIGHYDIPAQKKYLSKEEINELPLTKHLKITYRIDENCNILNKKSNFDY